MSKHDYLLLRQGSIIRVLLRHDGKFASGRLYDLSLDSFSLEMAGPSAGVQDTTDCRVWIEDVLTISTLEESSAREAK